MRLYTVYLLLQSALHISSVDTTHHQEHITVFTASGTGRIVWAATARYRGWTETLSTHDNGR